MSACKELHSVSHTENISLSYDPFIETKNCLKMHVVPGNFIVASIRTNRAIDHQVLRESRLRSFSITVEEYRHQVEQKLQN